MKQNWQTAANHIFNVEGGYVNHPADPGGCTNLGITLRTLRDFRHDKNAKCTAVRDLTRAEAAIIYKQRYWDVVSGDELPSGLDLAVFDYAVNSGPRHAAKKLQQLLGVDPDGEIGPITLRAAFADDPEDLIHLYVAARLEFLKNLRHWNTFGRGWTNRLVELKSVALGLVGQPAPEPSPEPVTELSQNELLIELLQQLLTELRSQ